MFLSCQQDKDKQAANVSENENAKFIVLNDFIEPQVMDSLMEDREPNFAKYDNGNSINYSYHSTFYSEKNKVKGAFISDVFEYQNENSAVEFKAFTYGLKYKLWEGNKMELSKNDHLTLNENLYEIYDVVIKDSQYKGKLYVVGKPSKNISFLFFNDGELNFDLNKIKQKLSEL